MDISKSLSTANPNWFNATKAEDVIPPPPLSQLGDDLVYYCGLTMLTQGPLAGMRFAEAMLPWQKRLIQWLDFVDEVAIKCGKGSGKSFLVAAIALGFVMRSAMQGKHRRGVVAIVAANVESSRIVFQHIMEAVLSDEHLKPLFKTNVQQRTLTHIESGIQIQIIPPTMKRAIGLRPILLILDEIHEAANVSEFTDVVAQLKKGGQNWDDFKLIGITTAPTKKSVGYYLDWLTSARAVRDGRSSNNRLLPALFEFPVIQRPDITTEDSEYWYFGMPSLITEPGGPGTMDVGQMRKELDLALEAIEITGSGDYQSLLSQRLGIELEERQGGGLTVLADLWDSCKVDTLPNLDLGHGSLILAFDPSSGISDPFAAVALYKSDNLNCFLSRQWLTNDGYTRAPNRLRRIYDAAIKAGELFLLDTSDEIATSVIAYGTGLMNQVNGSIIFGGDAAGLSGFKERFESELGEYHSVAQGWQLMAAFNALEGDVHGRAVAHKGQPLLSANIKNLRVVNGRLVKADGHADSGIGWDKVDGAFALLSAVMIYPSTASFSVDAMIG